MTFNQQLLSDLVALFIVIISSNSDSHIVFIDNTDVVAGLLSTLGDPGRAEGNSKSSEREGGGSILNIFLTFAIGFSE